MSSLGARAVVFCFPVVLGWLPLAAQSSSYHLEFEEHTPNREAILVNDSEKSIEAQGGFERCQKTNGGGGVSGVYENKDILDWPSGRASDIRDADATWPSRSGVLETGARWGTGLWISPENGDCQGQINAVLFSDGSFEGEDTALRGLKAHRDGLAAGANYWADRINRENPDGSTLDALLDELKQHVVDDQVKQKKYRLDILDEHTPPPFWQYWSGWLQVERNIEHHFQKELSQEKASETFRKVAYEINQWKKKIDGNLALQKLNLTFPAISESGDRQ